MQNKNPSVGEYGYFLEVHILVFSIFILLNFYICNLFMYLAIT